MTGRLAWGLLPGLVAAVVIVAQVDRRARYQPALAAFVPAGLGGFADEQRVRAAIVAGDGERALTGAQALVRARPMPAGNLTTLAVAAALDGDAESAGSALEAASMRGWRDPLAQIASAQAALQQGAWDIAARRLAALMATGDLPQETRALMLALMGEAEGRAALAAIYVQEGHWQPRALATLAANAPAPQFADWILRVRAAGGSPDCTALAPVAERYRRAGDAAAAARLLGEDCR